MTTNDVQIGSNMNSMLNITSAGGVLAVDEAPTITSGTTKSEKSLTGATNFIRFRLPLWHAAEMLEGFAGVVTAGCQTAAKSHVQGMSHDEESIARVEKARSRIREITPTKIGNAMPPPIIIDVREKDEFELEMEHSPLYVTLAPRSALIQLMNPKPRRGAKWYRHASSEWEERLAM